MKRLEPPVEVFVICRVQIVSVEMVCCCRPSLVWRVPDHGTRAISRWLWITLAKVLLILVLLVLSCSLSAPSSRRRTSSGPVLRVAEWRRNFPGWRCWWRNLAATSERSPLVRFGAWVGSGQRIASCIALLGSPSSSLELPLKTFYLALHLFFAESPTFFFLFLFQAICDDKTTTGDLNTQPS